MAKHPCGKQLCRQRHKIEKLFGRLKDRRRTTGVPIPSCQLSHAPQRLLLINES